MKSKLLLVALAWLMMMCNNNEPEATGPGHVTFGIPANLTGGRTSAEEFDEAIITIKSTSGEVVYDGRVALTLFGESYVSEQLELNTGAYTLAKFILVKSTVAKYASPLAGSPKASLVEHSLPLEFSVQTNEVTTLLPEVVAVGDAAPGAFGYVDFGFEIINDSPDNKTLQIFATIAADKAHAQLTGGIFEVQAKNASGQVTWSKTWPIDDKKQIVIPPAHHYSFVLSKAAHISHKQYYTTEDLSGATSLSFELIPEGSKDFVVLNSFNDSLTIYYPADRTKLYLRADRAEGLDLIDLYTDRTVWSMTSLPLRPAEFKEFSTQKEMVGFAINVYGNVPFSDAIDIRTDTDMSHSSFTKDFDRDVVVDAYTVAVTRSSKYFDHYTNWDFNELPFYQYWCSVTHEDSFCNHANGRTGSSGRVSERRDSNARVMKKRELLTNDKRKVSEAVSPEVRKRQQFQISDF